MPRYIWWLLGAALVVAPLLSGNRYFLYIATMVTILIPMALSINLTLRLGQLSLAQPAFMGIGAYTSALLVMNLGVPSGLAILAGGLLATLAAVVVGPIFLRVKGVYFVLLTYSFAQIVNLNFQYWTTPFGGNNGLFGIPPISYPGGDLISKNTFYFLLGLILTAISLYIMRRFEKSDSGMICDALNEDEMLCLALGSNALSWRIAAFACSALMAGISGGVYAFFIGFISPDSFGFQLSVDLIVMNVVGGVSSTFGPVLGSVIIVPLLELLRDARQYQLLVYGLCLLFFMLFCRKGLVSLVWRGLRRNSFGNA